MEVGTWVGAGRRRSSVESISVQPDSSVSLSIVGEYKRDSRSGCLLHLAQELAKKLLWNEGNSSVIVVSYTVSTAFSLIASLSALLVF
jgi:hypothetical protein